MATVCIRMDAATYAGIVASLPAYQGNSNIFDWLPTQSAYTAGQVANPPGETARFRMFTYTAAAPAATFTLNAFQNVIF